MKKYLILVGILANYTICQEITLKSSDNQHIKMATSLTKLSSTILELQKTSGDEPVHLTHPEATHKRLCTLAIPIIWIACHCLHNRKMSPLTLFRTYYPEILVYNGHELARTLNLLNFLDVESAVDICAKLVSNCSNTKWNELRSIVIPDRHKLIDFYRNEFLKEKRLEAYKFKSPFEGVILHSGMLPKKPTDDFFDWTEIKENPQEIPDEDGWVHVEDENPKK